MDLPFYVGGLVSREEKQKCTVLDGDKCYRGMVNDVVLYRVV